MPSILLDWQPLKPVRTKGSILTLKLKKYEFFSLDVATKVYKTCVKLEVLNCTISEIFAYWGNFRVFMLIVVILWYFSNFKGSCLCYTNSNWGDFFLKFDIFFKLGSYLQPILEKLTMRVCSIFSITRLIDESVPNFGKKVFQFESFYFEVSRFLEDG